MKVKGLLAAALCCVTFLTGCGNGSGENERSSSEYSDSSSASKSVISTVESSEQSTSTTEMKQSESSSSSSSEPEEVKNEIPTPYIYRIFEFSGITELQWTTDDKDFRVDESYKMRVFWSSTLYGQEKSEEFWAYKTISFLTDDLFNGDNYFRIQLYNSDGVSEVSEPFCYTRTGTDETPSIMETPKVHQYTHTFEAPQGFVIVPDYSDAINDINNGVQPTEFYAEMTFVCPGCGGKNYMPGKYFSYTEDSSAYCRMQCSRDTRCPYNKYSYVYVNSYAVQIS